MATCNPIVPIGNGLASLLVWRVTRKLFEWHRKPEICVLDEYGQLRHAVDFCYKVDHFNLNFDFKR